MNTFPNNNCSGNSSSTVTYVLRFIDLAVAAITIFQLDSYESLDQCLTSTEVDFPVDSYTYTFLTCSYQYGDTIDIDGFDDDFFESTAGNVLSTVMNTIQ